MTQNRSSGTHDADGDCHLYPEPRDLSAREQAHPMAQAGWRAVGHSTFEGSTDTLLLENGGLHRLIEFYDDYAWAGETRGLEWAEFVDQETESGDRKGWTASIRQKLGCYGFTEPEPRVFVARNEDFGTDWLIGLEF